MDTSTSQDVQRWSQNFVNPCKDWRENGAGTRQTAEVDDTTTISFLREAIMNPSNQT